MLKWSVLKCNLEVKLCPGVASSIGGEFAMVVEKMVQNPLMLLTTVAASVNHSALKR
jgi:hypothetical protein